MVIKGINHNGSRLDIIKHGKATADASCCSGDRNHEQGSVWPGVDFGNDSARALVIDGHSGVVGEAAGLQEMDRRKIPDPDKACTGSILSTYRVFESAV